jgi:tetratricopeptide (TPR) repeat protein
MNIYPTAKAVMAGGWIALLAFAPAAGARADTATNAPVPQAELVSARDFYNAGTRSLTAKKYTDAEQMFQAALALQDERVQPPALFNLGHARFAEGMEILKQGPSAQRTMSQANQALTAGDHAITQAQSALAQGGLDRIVDAYLEGRGARRELREAEKAVKQAMETYGSTLNKWQRAADDFKSAAELNPADTNAVQNAKTVEQSIAKLVDMLQKLQQMAGMLGGQRQQLGELMTKLKGQAPGFQAPPGSSGEDDEDDISPGSLAGQKEGASKTGEGNQMQVSPDQAQQIMDGIPIDSGKGLPMGGDQEGTPANGKKGRIW